MINHLVLMNLKDAQDTDTVAREVLSMKGNIPGLVDVVGGPSVVTLATTWDLGFVMTFSTAADVLLYQDHDVHVRVGERIRPLIQEMATCDLPVSGSEYPA